MERDQVLTAAQVNETTVEPEIAMRIDKWIQVIGPTERERKSNLTEQDRRLEDEMATKFEYIGWILRQYIEQWWCLKAAQSRSESDDIKC